MTENKDNDIELMHAELNHKAERTLTFHEAKVLGDELKQELKKGKLAKDDAKLKEVDIDDHYLTLG